jgi:hypothetical protein
MAVTGCARGTDIEAVTMKRVVYFLFALIISASFAESQNIRYNQINKTDQAMWPAGSIIVTNTIAGANPLSGLVPARGWVRLIPDGTSPTDCSIGGGGYSVFCWWNGTAWVQWGGGGGTPSIPFTTVDISTPGTDPASGSTTWYSKSGTICALSPTGSETCTGSGGSSYYQTVQANGTSETQRAKLNLKSGTGITVSAADNSGAGSTDVTFTATTVHQYGGAFGVPGGTALTTGGVVYFVIPQACTINAWDILVDAGTATVKFWKIATGTAIPTSANSINTSGVSISTGTAVHSSTVTDFTTTTVAAHDIGAVTITAVSTAAFVYATFECQ